MKRVGTKAGFPFALLALGMGLLMRPAAAQNTERQTERQWTVGTPIVTYWAGPAMTDDAARQMRDGGWNLVWCAEKELDVAERNGLRAQLTDPLLTPASLDDTVRRAALDALISRVRSHRALYSYFLNDEPSAGKFPEVGRLIAYLRARDPDHLAYVNLFPMGATNEQLGTTGDAVTAYREYLRQFVEVARPSLLSYDNYPFAAASDYPDYFQNLALVRSAALAAGLPFLNIVQACTWTPRMRAPDEAEMRVLVYTTLAYGASGISYYVYSYPGHTPAIATLDGKPTRVYDWLQKLNPEFAAIASQVQGLRSIGAYHAGMLPPGTEPLPKDAAFTLDPPIQAAEFQSGKPVKGVLLGCFGKQVNGIAGASHVIIVNLDYGAEATLTLRGRRALEVYDIPSHRWIRSRAKQVTLRLPPGGGKLVRASGR